MTKEIIILPPEEQIAEVEEQLKTLHKRLLLMDTSETIELSDIIGNIRKRLKNYINSINN